ncbi:sulfite oxidase [Nocardioides mangrovicus]|uniref:Sulfite oxidase n=2 Tax=Nocardioides mangrovicus TaxID=2478913 RepID=A0A3L8P750_9ACTN|nr:sulfite oxidase [Nocardioides mangrovicus]
MLVHEDEPFNAEPTPKVLGRSTLTPINAFYSRNHGPIPTIDHDKWRLVVDGLVDTPLELSLADLKSQFEIHEVVATLQCAGNRRAGFLAVADIPGEDPWQGGAIGTAVWAGARLVDVLAAAGLADDSADLHVDFSAPDVSELATPPQAYGSSIPLSKAMQTEVLLAWRMNGRDLPRVHGAPVRVVAPAYIGARSVKWIDRISVQTTPSDNYFQATAYRILAPSADPDQAGPGDGISLGPWALNSEILTPTDDGSVPAGAVAVTGYAVAPEHRRVVRVEVSADEGATWHDALLDEQPSPWTWVHWRTNLDLDPGNRTLVARAWDDTGTQQPQEAASLWNPKGYGNTAWPTKTIHVDQERGT